MEGKAYLCPGLSKPGGGCGIHRTLVPPYPSGRGRFRPLRFMFYAMRHALCLPAENVYCKQAVCAMSRAPCYFFEYSAILILES